MSAREFGRLMGALVVPQLVGIAGALITYPAIPSWYRSLHAPVFAPPSWVFAPVWTLLYILMGTASYLVWRRGFHTDGVRHALRIYGIQLALNLAWSIIFFGMHAIGLALICITILWIAIIFTILGFAPVSRAAAWLLAPYAAWVSFAALLNYGFWILNSGY
jgi:tryptophan-rich sensory protein